MDSYFTDEIFACMEPKTSLPRSQIPTIEPYLEPDEFGY